MEADKRWEKCATLHECCALQRVGSCVHLLSRQTVFKGTRCRMLASVLAVRLCTRMLWETFKHKEDRRWHAVNPNRAVVSCNPHPARLRSRRCKAVSMPRVLARTRMARRLWTVPPPKERVNSSMLGWRCSNAVGRAVPHQANPSRANCPGGNGMLHPFIGDSGIIKPEL